MPSTARWSDAELESHAALAVSSTVLNSGHNCNATEIIVTAKGWPQRQAFQDALARVLSELYERWPWYPGSEVRAACKLCFRAPALHMLGRFCCWTRFRQNKQICSAHAPELEPGPKSGC